MSEQQAMTPQIPEEHAAEFPLQIQQYPFGWEVVYYAPSGFARHVATADNESAAFRIARDVGRVYGHKGRTLVQSGRGEYTVDLEKVVHNPNS
ncbi:MAG: hypothetical protein ACQERG_06105 [Pseudomonadota bacterium]